MVGKGNCDRLLFTMVFFQIYHCHLSQVLILLHFSTISTRLTLTTSGFVRSAKSVKPQLRFLIAYFDSLSDLLLLLAKGLRFQQGWLCLIGLFADLGRVRFRTVARTLVVLPRLAFEEIKRFIHVSYS